MSLALAHHDMAAFGHRCCRQCPPAMQASREQALSAHCAQVHVIGAGAS
jgi:hypothetical protein